MVPEFVTFGFNIRQNLRISTTFLIRKEFVGYFGAVFLSTLALSQKNCEAPTQSQQ